MSAHGRRISSASAGPNDPFARAMTEVGRPSATICAMSSSRGLVSLPAVAEAATVNFGEKLASTEESVTAAAYESDLNVQVEPSTTAFPLILPAAVTDIVIPPPTAPDDVAVAEGSDSPSKFPMAHAGRGSTVRLTTFITLVLPAVVTVIFTSEGTTPLFLSTFDAADGAP